MPLVALSPLSLHKYFLVKMGAILDTPHTEKTTENGTGNELRYGVCSMQGWRVEMEDAHCAQVGLPDLKDWSFFAGKSECCCALLSHSVL